MGMMEDMMELMLAKLTKEQKQQMMEKATEKFFADVTADDKQKMMEAMMAKMMQGVNITEMMPQMMMGMMPQIMGGGNAAGVPMMPEMMTQMMPMCLGMMLPRLPKEKRVDFMLGMISAFKEHGYADMSEDEKREFKTKVAETF
jgi:ribosomal protein S6E (S10)